MGIFSREGDAVFAAELTLQLYVKSRHLAGMCCSMEPTDHGPRDHAENLNVS